MNGRRRPQRGLQVRSLIAPISGWMISPVTGPARLRIGSCSGFAPISRNSGFTADWVRPKLNWTPKNPRFIIRMAGPVISGLRSTCPHPSRPARTWWWSWRPLRPRRCTSHAFAARLTRAARAATAPFPDSRHRSSPAERSPAGRGSRPSTGRTARNAFDDEQLRADVTGALAATRVGRGRGSRPARLRRPEPVHRHPGEETTVSTWKTIVVGVDGSPGSRKRVDLGGRRSRGSPGRPGRR